MDEAILEPVAQWLVLRLVPSHICAETGRQAKAWMAEHRAHPYNYCAAAAVMAAWGTAT